MVTMDNIFKPKSEIPDKVKVGMYFRLSGIHSMFRNTVYQLVCAPYHNVVLVSIDGKGYWTKEIRVNDMDNITREEAKCLCGTSTALSDWEVLTDPTEILNEIRKTLS